MSTDSQESQPSLTTVSKILEDATWTDFSSRFMLVEGIEKCPIPMFVIDHEHVITSWNTALANLSGLTGAEMVGTRNQWKGAYGAERPTLADLIIDGTLEQEIDVCYHGKYRRSSLLENGVEVCDFFPGLGEGGRWLFLAAAPLRDPSGRIVGAIETIQDVTRSRRVETALREGRNLLEQIVAGNSIPTFVIDREHRITHWNRACEIVTGVAASDVVGTREQWRAFYISERPVMADLILNSALEREIDQFYHGKFHPSELLAGAFEAEDFFPQLGKNGRWLFFTAAPLRDATDNLIGVIETLQDITEQKLVEQALRDSEEKYKMMSITDALTSLFNSRHFYEQIGIETTRAKRYGRALSLILLDLDNFKKINDIHGHLEGDRVLTAVAGVIANNLRSMDSAYRYGGEEFTLLLPETGIESALVLAERLRRSIADISLTTFAGAAIAVTVSIGVAEYASPEIVQSFVRRADDGVYEAKRKGKNQIFANTVVTEDHFELRSIDYPAA